MSSQNRVTSTMRGEKNTSNKAAADYRVPMPLKMNNKENKDLMRFWTKSNAHSKFLQNFKNKHKNMPDIMMDSFMSKLREKQYHSNQPTYAHLHQSNSTLNRSDYNMHVFDLKLSKNPLYQREIKIGSKIGEQLN